MDKLKPCPFCGGEAELFKDQHDTLKIGYDYFVWCCDVECNGGTDEYTKSDLAIKKWNTRTPDKESVNNAQRYKEALEAAQTRINYIDFAIENIERTHNTDFKSEYDKGMLAAIRILQAFKED